LAPAAGPGWEEPTSQLCPGLRPELDYVFTPAHNGGSAYDDRSSEWRTRAYVATRRNVTRPSRDTRACPPSHLITHIFFCALSRYGVTTVRSFPLADSFFSGIRDVCSDWNRLFRAEIERCFRRMPLTSTSFFHDSECFVPLDFPRRCPLPLFPKRPFGRPG